MTDQKQSEEVDPAVLDIKPGTTTEETSEDQVEDQAGSVDQPEEESPKEPSVQIDGEEVPLEELKKGYMRQKDYTQKTQALSEQRKALGAEPVQETNEVDPSLEQAVQVLKQQGFATKEDLVAMKAAEEDSKKLDDLLEANPDLKQHEKAIRKIGEGDNSAWEDIIQNYGFNKGNKLAKAKTSRPIKGASQTSVPAKSLKDLSPDEFEAWKRANLMGSSKFTRK